MTLRSDVEEILRRNVGATKIGSKVIEQGGEADLRGTKQDCSL